MSPPPCGEDLRLVFPGTSVPGHFPAEHIRGSDAEPFGRNSPEAHRNLRGIDHQLVTDTPERDGEPFLEVQDDVVLGDGVQLPGFQLQKLVAPHLQLIEPVTGYDSLLADQL